MFKKVFKRKVFKNAHHMFGKIIVAMAFIFLVFVPSLLHSQTINSVDVRLEGTNVFYRSTPDSVFARVSPGVPFNIVWSFELAVGLNSAILPMKLYSPDGSITSVVWNSPVTPTAVFSDPSVFTLGGTQFQEGADGFDGSLPSTFLTGGVGFANLPTSFGPTAPQDILVGTLTVSQEGLLCIDSTFFPPAGVWLFTTDGEVGIDVNWGASSGGYPSGGFCFEIADCTTCDVAGDANDDGEVNIGDVSYLLAWIFGGGPYPPCIRQADANGDGKNQVGDVVWLVGWIFSGGAAPVCGP